MRVVWHLSPLPRKAPASAPANFSTFNTSKSAQAQDQDSRNLFRGSCINAEGFQVFKHWQQGGRTPGGSTLNLSFTHRDGSKEKSRSNERGGLRYAILSPSRCMHFRLYTGAQRWQRSSDQRCLHDLSPMRKTFLASLERTRRWRTDVSTAEVI